MLSLPDAQKIRDELTTSKSPVIIFHDCPDGLASYVLLRKWLGRGIGIPLKANPHLTTEFIPLVKRHSPDKVFIVDIALADQEFIDEIGVPVIWIDHHVPQTRERLLYFNPRSNPQKNGPNIPATVLCMDVTNNPNDTWIAVVGAIADWHIPEFLPLLQEQYPNLLPYGTTVEQALFETQIGVLCRVFSFILKGDMAIVKNNIELLLTVQNPNDILNQQTPEGTKIWQHYSRIQKEYERLKEKALQGTTQGDLYIFTYTADELSLTRDLANELLYRLPDKVILLGRQKNQDYKCSIRAKTLNIAAILPLALSGIRGRGGGHEQAVGVSVHHEDWDTFVFQLMTEVKKAKDNVREFAHLRIRSLSER